MQNDNTRGWRETRYQWLTLRRDIISLDSDDIPGDVEQFEVEFLEAVVGRDPCEESSLALLGHIYTRQGEYAKGLEIDLRLARLRPDDPIAHYNLACSLSLVNRVDEALDALEQAVELGYRDLPHLLQDEDLANLRSDPRFHAFCLRTGLLDPDSPGP